MRLVLLLVVFGASCAAQAQVKPMIVRPPSQPEDERRETRPAAKMAPQPGKPPTKPLMVVRPAEPPDTPPSKAEQMQRRLDDERRIQRGERSPASGNFR